MNFFSSVFSDDPDSPPPESDSPDPPQSDTVWSFGGLIQTLASKSESVLGNYRRDLEEFGSGLRKETAVIREAASRAVMDLPASLDAGASVAQESLESVGQAIDDIGSTVWNSTAQIISHGRETLLASDFDSDSSNYENSSNNNNNNNVGKSGSGSGDLKRYSRFDTLVRALQSDENTYLEEPEDLGNFNEWKLGFELDKKGEEIRGLIEENGVVEEIYEKVVPYRTDDESFWSRYFYRLHKLKQAEDARAKLVKRAIAGDDEEDLSWDFDDDDDNDNDGADGDKLDVKCEEKEASEVKTDNDNNGSCKDSDISVVSTQPSMPGEEDIGWDEIEDIESNEESKEDAVGSANRIDLRKKLSVADQDEDLSWDIEDDDEAVKS
uniref:BSD domain-containing protein 1 n=1 Tax=Cajanus cajan TaxID=3821 RepID=A0A151U0M7_CAJCA|nr:BSD domain-containing protein 1 [Cajanus cajan]